MINKVDSAGCREKKRYPAVLICSVGIAHWIYVRLNKRKEESEMREIVFKMERPGLVEVGQEVDVSESITPVNVNYMIEPAVAMSGLFRFTERLKSRKGIVKEIIQNDRGYYVTVEFDE